MKRANDGIGPNGGPNGGPTPPLGEVFEFMRLLWALDHGVRLVSGRMVQKLGIAYPHRLVIRILGRFPGLAPGQLARILHLHPSSISAALDHLGKRGMIRRWPDPRDGRRVLIGLTPKGRRYDVKSAVSVEAVVSRTLRSVPPARVAAAREVLTALTAALEAAHGG